MNQISLATALGVLRDTVSTHNSSLHPTLRQEIGDLTLQLLTALSTPTTEDPRTVLHTATLIEQHYRTALRHQLHITAAAEATAAHTLSTTEYNRLTNGTTNWDQPPEHTTGRTAHKDTAALLARWLGINDFEAQTRLHDTHRLINRRTIAGTTTTPRYTHLSRLFHDPTQDPRPARDAARRLEKFEPADTINQGTPLPPTATGPDGIPLEEHAAHLLQDHDRATAAKRLTALCTAYKQANTQAIKPTEYFRRIRTALGVDTYQFTVTGTNAEVLRSLIAQLDNPNTQAGKAARTTGHPTTTPQTAPTDPDPDWLTSTTPPPDWATDPNTHPAPATPRTPPPEPPTTGVPDPGIPVDQRRLNGFLALLKQRTTSTGNTTQVIPTINVYMHLSQLMDLAHAHGITTHGVKINPTELRRTLCDAKIISHVLGGQGQILDQGRARRIYTPTQRTSLLARDRGCIRPGCSYPPELCEAHHWDDGGWAGGCPTDVDKGAMLCPRDHDDNHAGKFTIVDINGLPHVLEPEYLDPTRTPRRNKYWFSNDEPDLTDPPPPLPPATPPPNDTG